MIINDYPPKPAEYYMDLDSIISAGNTAIGILNRIRDTERHIENAESYCENGAMEVNELSIKDPISELKNQIIWIETKTSNAISELMGEASSLYQQLDQRYFAYQQELARKAANKNETEGDS